MKKTVPLSIRRMIDSYTKEHPDLFKVVSNKSDIIKLVDADPESDFYFQIYDAQENHSSNKKPADILFSVYYVPYHHDILEPVDLNLNRDNLKIHFEKWIKFLIDFNKPSVAFEDNISQAYYDELEPKFQNVDEDADFAPFSIEQQKTITLFLNECKKVVNAQKKDIGDAKSIVALIEETKRTMSRSTKKEVVNTIRKIIAKSFKMGLDIGERLLVKFTAEFAYKMITGH